MQPKRYETFIKEQVRKFAFVKPFFVYISIKQTFNYQQGVQRPLQV